jgi:hypothetical protein
MSPKVHHQPNDLVPMTYLLTVASTLLTQRESQVLAVCLAQTGKPLKYEDIANPLGFSVRSAQQHVQNLSEKQFINCARTAHGLVISLRPEDDWRARTPKAPTHKKAAAQVTETAVTKAVTEANTAPDFDPIKEIARQAEYARLGAEGKEVIITDPITGKPLPPTRPPSPALTPPPPSPSAPTVTPPHSPLPASSAGTPTDALLYTHCLEILHRIPHFRSITIGDIMGLTVRWKDADHRILCAMFADLAGKERPPKWMQKSLQDPTTDWASRLEYHYRFNLTKREVKIPGPQPERQRVTPKPSIGEGGKRAEPAPPPTLQEWADKKPVSADKIAALKAKLVNDTKEKSK